MFDLIKYSISMSDLAIVSGKLSFLFEAPYLKQNGMCHWSQINVWTFYVLSLYLNGLWMIDITGISDATSLREFLLHWNAFSFSPTRSEPSFDSIYNIRRQNVDKTHFYSLRFISVYDEEHVLILTDTARISLCSIAVW